MDRKLETTVGEICQPIMRIDRVIRRKVKLVVNIINGIGVRNTQWNGHCWCSENEDLFCVDCKVRSGFIDSWDDLKENNCIIYQD